MACMNISCCCYVVILHRRYVNKISKMLYIDIIHFEINLPKKGNILERISIFYLRIFQIRKCQPQENMGNKIASPVILK